MSLSALPPNVQPSTLIDPQRLIGCLGTKAVRLDLCAIDQCASTNSLLMAALSSPLTVGLPVHTACQAVVDNVQKNAAPAAPGVGAPRGLVLIADRQTAGRGRRGRAWISSPAASLTFSLAWPFAGGAALSGLSLAVGVALRQALQGLGYRGIGLKWPNDLLVQTPDGFAKLGGVLIELSVFGAAMHAIIGVGLNLQSPDAGGHPFDQAVAGLDQVGAGTEAIDRHVLLAALLTALVDALDRFAAQGFLGFRADWNAANAFAEREVMLMHEGRPATPGRCLGVDDAGALRVQTAQGEVLWLAGDVLMADGPSLRLQAESTHDSGQGAGQ